MVNRADQIAQLPLLRQGCILDEDALRMEEQAAQDWVADEGEERCGRHDAGVVVGRLQPPEDIATGFHDVRAAWAGHGRAFL
jgi:hypothetical protein